MKNLFLFGLFFLPVFVSAQKKLRFSGSVKDVPDGTILKVASPDGSFADSTKIRKGKFHLSAKIKEEGIYLISIPEFKGKSGSIVSAYIEPGRVKYDAAGPLLGSPKYSGKHFTKDYNSYNEYTRGFSGDSLEQRAHRWMSEHRGSPITLFNLNISYALQQLDWAVLEDYLQKTPKRLHNNSIYVVLEKLSAIEKKTAIGQTALDFTQNDPSGKPISLSSLRGKYVLLDFWASWCKPCRAENPNVVRAYKQFRHKNFEILAVSLDHNLENWKQAIEADKLTWLNVSDLGGWKNAVAVEYGISGVPMNLLIDPNGKIIARNLKGDKLHQELSRILN